MFPITASWENMYIYLIKRAAFEMRDSVMNRRKYRESKYHVIKNAFPLPYVSLYEEKDALNFSVFLRAPRKIVL